jgi:hypothetical protein
MRKSVALALVLFLAVPLPRLAVAQAPPVETEEQLSDEPVELPIEWTVEAFQGGAHSLPTKLTIRQLGFPPINVNARYAVRPHDFPLYYAVRVARWQGDRAWAVQLVHYKLILKEPPPEIQHFEITHGYNLLTLDRLWRVSVWRVPRALIGVGGGLVVAHPENQVRGRALDSGGIAGYHLAGPTGAVLAGFDYRIGDRWFLAAEGRFSGSYARVPVDDGHASVPDFGLHGHVGAGYRFGPRSR